MKKQLPLTVLVLIGTFASITSLEAKTRGNHEVHIGLKHDADNDIQVYVFKDDYAWSDYLGKRGLEEKISSLYLDAFKAGNKAAPLLATAFEKGAKLIGEPQAESAASIVAKGLKALNKPLDKLGELVKDAFDKVFRKKALAYEWKDHVKPGGTNGFSTSADKLYFVFVRRGKFNEGPLYQGFITTNQGNNQSNFALELNRLSDLQLTEKKSLEQYDVKVHLFADKDSMERFIKE